MALGRGERIGEAYIRIHADGSNLSQEVRDELADADDAFDAAGKRHSQAYTDAYAEQQNSRTSRAKMREGIINAVARGDYLNKEFFGGPTWTEFKRNMESRFGEVGRVAAANLQNDLVNGLDFSGLDKRMENITAELARATRDIQRAEAEQQSEALEMNKRFDRERLAQHRAMLDEAHALNRAFDRQRLNEQQAMLFDAYNMNRAFDRRNRELIEAYAENERITLARNDAEFERHVRDRSNLVEGLREKFESLTDEIDRMDSGTAGHRGRSVLIADLEDVRRKMIDAGGASDDWTKNLNDQDRRLRFMHPTLNRFSNRIGDVADKIGGAFGRGSRNDFVNFIGSMARGLVNVLQIIPGIARGFLKIGETAKFAFDESIRGGGSTFRATMAGLTASLETAGVAAGVFAVALLGVMAIIGPLVALLSLLTGIVVALASSIVFGLIGAVAALGGALIPVIGLFGGLALGLASVDWANAGRQVDLLGEKFQDVSNALGRGLMGNIDKQAPRISKVLEGLIPIARRLGEAISNVADSWLDAVDSPGYHRFRDVLENWLPGAVEQVGRIIGNAFGGLGGIFTALTPITDRFLDWLEKITGEFARWANTVEGQRAIKQFLDEAGDSAKSLGKFLLEAGDFLFDLMRPGRATGDSMLDRMTAALDDLGTWLDEHPDALSKWFSDAEDLFVDIGKLVTAIGSVVDALDNAGTRIAANTFVDVIARFFRGLGRIIETASATIRTAINGIRRLFSGDVGARGLSARIASPFTGLAGRIIGNLPSLPGRIRAIWDRLPPPARSAATRIATAFAPIPSLIARGLSRLPGLVRGIMDRTPGIARSAANRVGAAWSGVQGRIRGFLNGIPGMVSNLMSRLPGPARNAARNVGSAFSNVAGRIRGFLNGIPGMVQGLMSRLPGPARNAAQNIGSAFSGVAGRVRGFLSGLPGIMRSVGSDMVSAASSIPGQIASQFSGLASRIISAVGTIHLPTPTINMPNIPKINIPGLAGGGIEQGLRGLGVLRRVGEDGPEAVVPLNRPLSQVDPSVRWLSAIAQGKIPGMANGGTTGGGKSINIAEGAIRVFSNAVDPRLVAVETVNNIVAQGY